MRPSQPISPTTWAILVVAFGLAACSAPDKFPPACPSLALLPDAADLTRYRAGGQDITDLIVDARITAIPAKCQPGEPGTVAASLKVAMAAQLGPAATIRRFTLPYFVAVMFKGDVVDKQDYVLTADFPSNANQALPSSPDIDLVLPVSREKSAAAYSIFVGYLLTPEELALNRRRGPR